jgi:hypothetical protein
LLGERMGEFLEPEEFLAAMEAEDAGLQVPGGLEDQLRAARDRRTSSLSREQWDAMRERAGQGAS